MKPAMFSLPPSVAIGRACANCMKIDLHPQDSSLSQQTVQVARTGQHTSVRLEKFDLVYRQEGHFCLEVMKDN